MPQRAIPGLAVIEAIVAFDQPVGIEKNSHSVRKIEATLGKTKIALGLIPLELHSLIVGQRPTCANRKWVNLEETEAVR